MTVSGSLTPSALNVNMRRGAALELNFALAVLSSTRQIAEFAQHVSTDLSRCTMTVAPAVKPERVKDVSAHCHTVPSGLLSKLAKIQADYCLVTVQRMKHRQRANENRYSKVPTRAVLCAAKANTPVYFTRLNYTTNAIFVKYELWKIK